MSEKKFPHKAQSRLDLGFAKETPERVEKGVKPAAMTPLDEDARLNTLKPPRMTPVRMQTNDALKPAAMTPLTDSGEDRGLKPTSMTPAHNPVQPVKAPSQRSEVSEKFLPPVLGNGSGLVQIESKRIDSLSLLLAIDTKSPEAAERC